MVVRRKRIVLATTKASRIGGIASFQNNLALTLKKRGWDVHFIVTSERGDFFEYLKKNVTCHDLSDIPLSVKKIFLAAELLNKISPEVLVMNHCSLINYTLPLLSIDIKPISVVHSDDLKFYLTATIFSHRLFRLIAPTRKLAERCRNYIDGKFEKRMRVIPHGINSDVFFYPPRKKMNSSKKITFVGFIDENKGADLLPDILAKVVDVHPTASLNVIGYGPLRDRLEMEFLKKKLSAKCKFTGPLESERVSEILKESDIFLLPTRVEGFGLAIIEAMISGAVPIISRLEGITDEIVEDNVTGLLVEVDNATMFADSIIGLLNYPTRLHAMSEAASSIAVEKYTETRMINDYEALFAENDDRGTEQCETKLRWFVETVNDILKKGRLGHVAFNSLKRSIRCVLNR